MSNRYGVAVRRAGFAGGAGGAAAVAAGVLALLVYGIGRAIEGDSGRGMPDDMDFTGLASAMVGVPCGAVGFLVFSWLLVRRAGLDGDRTREVVVLGVMLTGIVLAGLMMSTERPGSALGFAVVGPLVAAACFGLVAFWFDERAKVSHRLAVWVVLLALISGFSHFF
ncbi:hypothetical protein GCM10022221_08840 [Actinocorallia aurea]